MNSHVARISVLVSIVALAAAISLTVVPHDGQGRAAAAKRCRSRATSPPKATCTT